MLLPQLFSLLYTWIKAWVSWLYSGDVSKNDWRPDSATALINHTYIHINFACQMFHKIPPPSIKRCVNLKKRIDWTEQKGGKAYNEQAGKSLHLLPVQPWQTAPTPVALRPHCTSLSGVGDPSSSVYCIE